MGPVANCRYLLCLACTFIYSLHPLFCFLLFHRDHGQKLHTGLNIIKAAVRTLICNWGLSLSIRNTLSFPISAPGPSLSPYLPPSCLHIEFLLCLLYKYSMFQPVIYTEAATPRYFHTWTPRRWHSSPSLSSPIFISLPVFPDLSVLPHRSLRLWFSLDNVILH